MAGSVTGNVLSRFGLDRKIDDPTNVGQSQRGEGHDVEAGHHL
jgi:hypothetical protein